MNRFLFGHLCLALLFAAVGLTACGGQKKHSNKTMPASVSAPAFSADSAYAFTARQMDFGARVPGTSAHRACGDFFVETLTRYGAVVTQQEDFVTAYDGSKMPLRNIVAAYRPELARRIFVSAHWDCRPWCDQDAAKYHHTPVPGANDGASGAAVLLELARQLQTLTVEGKDFNLGVDLIFFDAEDAGTPSWETRHDEDSWCLGSQYWARRPHVDGYRAEYGILLDMVGGQRPGFFLEQISMVYAADVLYKVWDKAAALGYGGLFINRTGGAITDDHLFVNRLAGIPCIDIIDFDESLMGGFPDTWHTHRDDLAHIDASSLQAVGATVLAVICDEAAAR